MIEFWGLVLTDSAPTFYDQLYRPFYLQLFRCYALCVEKKHQLDATELLISLMICSTCCGHFYIHHQELETICVLLPSMMCDALVAVCWRSGTGQQTMQW